MIRLKLLSISESLEKCLGLDVFRTRCPVFVSMSVPKSMFMSNKCHVPRTCPCPWLCLCLWPWNMSCPCPCPCLCSCKMNMNTDSGNRHGHEHEQGQVHGHLVEYGHGHWTWPQTRMDNGHRHGSGHSHDIRYQIALLLGYSNIRINWQVDTVFYQISERKPFIMTKHPCQMSDTSNIIFYVGAHLWPSGTCWWTTLPIHDPVVRDFS